MAPRIMQQPFNGDYSQDLFSERKQFLGAIFQQGKKLIDADCNDSTVAMVSRLQRMIQSAFPAQAVGKAFKIQQSGVWTTNNFLVRGCLDDGFYAQAAYPETYAKLFVGGLCALISNCTTTASGSEGIEFHWAGPTSGGGEYIAGALHHRSTALSALVLTDTNARFVVNSLKGMTLIPSVQIGSTHAYQILSNTETQITVLDTGGTDMTVWANAGEFYRIMPSTPTAGGVGIGRRDLVFLDIYVGEMDSTEDTTLLHPIASGYEAARRMVIRQQVLVLENKDAGGNDVLGSLTDPSYVRPGLPWASDPTATESYYQDGNGQTHYCVALAELARPQSASSITSAYITDLRDPYFGSSREVVEARRGYDNLYDSIEAAENKPSRAMAVPYEAPSPVMLTNTNVLQITDTAYVGESVSDNIKETLKLFEYDPQHPSVTSRNPVRGDPASLISPITSYDSLTGQDLAVRMRDDVTGAVISSTTGNFGGCASPLTAAQLVLLLNGTVFPAMDITFTGLGTVKLNTVLVAQEIQGKYLGLRSLITGRYSYIEILSTYPISNLFGAINPATHFYQKFAAYEGPGNTFSSVRSYSGLEPEIMDIVDAGGTSIIGGTTTPKFFLNPYFCFDMILNVQAIARYGIKTTFSTEPAKAYMQRDLHNGRSQLDYRLHVEHDVDGQHQREFLTESMIDRGIGADQVNAASIRLFATITNVGTANVTTIQQALTAVLPLAGGTLTGLLTITPGAAVGLNMTSSRIASVADPVNPQDAATKAYVDAVAAGLDIKPSCVAMADSPGTLATSFKAGDTLDGVVLSLGQRILLTAQAAPKENGIWVVTNAAPTRPADFCSTTPNTTGAMVFIEDGTNYHDTQWVMTTYPNPVIDTDANDWTQFAGAGTYTWRDGIDVTGMTVDVKVTAPITISGGVGSGGAVSLAYSRNLQVVTNTLDVKTSEFTGDGLEVAPSIDAFSGALRIASTAAGNGLTGGSGSPLAVLANPANTTITVAVAGVSVKLAASSGLAAAATGLRLDSTLAGAGLYWSSSYTAMAVGAGNGISVAADAVAVNNGNNLGFDGSALVTLGVSSWASGDSGTVSNTNRKVIIGSYDAQITGVPKGTILASETSVMVGLSTGEEDVAIIASSDVIMWAAMEQTAFVGVYDCDVQLPTSATSATVRRAIMGGSSTSYFKGDDDSSRLYDVAAFACTGSYVSALDATITGGSLLSCNSSFIKTDGNSITQVALVAADTFEVKSTRGVINQAFAAAVNGGDIQKGSQIAIVASYECVVGTTSGTAVPTEILVAASDGASVCIGSTNGDVERSALVATLDCNLSHTGNQAQSLVAASDNASVFGVNGSANCAVIACNDGHVSSNSEAVYASAAIGCVESYMGNNHAVMLASRLCQMWDGGAELDEDSGHYTVQGGWNDTGLRTHANIKWCLSSYSGDLYLAGIVQDSYSFDVAEYFESADGLPIPVGTIVTSAGAGKIQVAGKNDDYLLGVVSRTAGLLMGGATFHWAGRYERGEFGEHVYEEVPDTGWKPKDGQTEEDRPKIRRKKEHSSYDPTQEYTPRAGRPEWHTVGLIGQVYTRCDSKLKAHDWVASGKDGCATPSQDRGMGWRCLKIVADYDEAKGYGVALVLIR